MAGTGPRIFLSSASIDGASLALRIDEGLSVHGFHVWRDRNRLNAGANWSKEIEDALDNSDHVVAIISPGANLSHVCRGEHLRALRKGKPVVPVLGHPTAEPPIYLEATQYIDFRNRVDIAEVVSELATPSVSCLPAAYRSTTVTAPAVPLRYSFPPELHANVHAALLADAPVLAPMPARMSVIAMLDRKLSDATDAAACIAHEPAVADMFPDGVIWIDSMLDTQAFVDQMADVARALRDDPARYLQRSAALNRLRSILRDRSVLVILNGVALKEQVDEFVAAAPKSKLLFTTGRAAVAAQADIVVKFGGRRIWLHRAWLLAGLLALIFFCTIVPYEVELKLVSTFRKISMRKTASFSIRTCSAGRSPSLPWRHRLLVRCRCRASRCIVCRAWTGRCVSRSAPPWRWFSEIGISDLLRTG